MAKIDQLNRNLERAWEKEQKVKALKIAIQVPCTRTVHSVQCGVVGVSDSAK